MCEIGELEQHTLHSATIAASAGTLKVRVRAALAPYFLRQWIVDCSEHHLLDGAEYRLWLRNSPILYGISGAHLAPGYNAVDNQSSFNF